MQRIQSKKVDSSAGYLLDRKSSEKTVSVLAKPKIVDINDIQLDLTRTHSKDMTEYNMNTVSEMIERRTTKSIILLKDDPSFRLDSFEDQTCLN